MREKSSKMIQYPGYNMVTALLLLVTFTVKIQSRKMHKNVWVGEEREKSKFKLVNKNGLDKHLQLLEVSAVNHGLCPGTVRKKAR